MDSADHTQAPGDDSPALLIARDTAEHAVEQLAAYRDALNTLSQRIIDHQQAKWGADRGGNILLRFNHCGHGCLGCPHPVWYILRLKRVTRYGPDYGKYFVTFQRISTPGRASRVRTNPTLHTMVKKANKLIATRTLLVDHLSRLRQHLAACHTPSSE